MSYNNSSYVSSSYQRPYSSQSNSNWSVGIEPFSRPQQSLNVEDYNYGSGYNNNRSLLPAPNDGPRNYQYDYDNGQRSYDNGQRSYDNGQRSSNMSMSNGPSRDDVYMSDMDRPMARPSDNYHERDNWDRSNSYMQTPMPWSNRGNEMNGQSQQFSGPVSFQPLFNSTLSGNSPRMQSNRLPRRNYQEPVRLNKTFREPTTFPKPQYAARITKWKTGKTGIANKNAAPANKRGLYFCKVCNLKFAAYNALIAHNKTSEHNRSKQLHENMQKKVAAAAAAKKVEAAKKTETQDPEATKQVAAQEKKLGSNKAEKAKNMQAYCVICKSKFTGSSIEHFASDKHKVNKAMDRPFCIQCQQFFRTPALFVKHCNSKAHKSGKAAGGKQEGESVIDAEFFTLDAVGIYDSEKSVKAKKKKKLATLNKIAISLPAGTVTQDPLKGSGIPVVSIIQKNGVETKSVSMKTAKEESVDEDPADIKPVGLAFVVPISGFYCQICEEFFKDENVARNDHCISKAHRKKYKDATVDESTAANDEAAASNKDAAASKEDAVASNEEASASNEEATASNEKAAAEPAPV